MILLCWLNNKNVLPDDFSTKKSHLETETISKRDFIKYNKMPYLSLSATNFRRSSPLRSCANSLPSASTTII